MPEQKPKDRIKNFNEVPYGYDEKTAIEEAKRCLQCKNRPCVDGCPVEIDIPEFIKEIAEGKIDEAVKVLKSKTSLPAVCGRVCPYENQCEGKCTLLKLGEPVGIGRLERFLADYERKKGVKIPKLPKSTGKKVAVVGAGPAGLTAADRLARKGYQLTVFEALPLAGGMLSVGIPDYRLPREVLNHEIDAITKLGVEIKFNSPIGKDLTIQNLFDQGYKAVFIATGAHQSMKLKVEGEDLQGVYHGVDFLRDVALGKNPEMAKKVAVIGFELIVDYYRGNLP